MNKTNPCYHGDYIPLQKRATKDRQVANIFLDSGKCYEKDKTEKTVWLGKWHGDKEAWEGFEKVALGQRPV